MRISTKYGFSLEINPKSYLSKHLAENDGVYEKPDSELVLSLVRPADFCIDAGAHVGYYTCLMASRGARVLAIEPNRQLYSALNKNIEPYDVHLSTMALSDDDSDGCDTTFYLPSEFDDGWGSLCAADRDDRSQTAKVCAMRLDSILAIGDLFPGIPKNIRLMKMDVEGAEVPALYGAGDRLQDIDYVLIECIDIPSRTKVFGSTVAGINEIFTGWQAKRFIGGQWRHVAGAISSGENFLFVNPRITE